MKKLIILLGVLCVIPVTIAMAILIQAVTSQENSTNVISDSALSLEDYNVSYSEDGFEPQQIIVPRGTQITFENGTDIPLYVASDPHPAHTDYSEFDAGLVLKKLPRPGENFSFTFDKPGTWKYHNHTAPEHTGTVTVN